MIFVYVLYLGQSKVPMWLTGPSVMKTWNRITPRSNIWLASRVESSNIHNWNHDPPPTYPIHPWGKTLFQAGLIRPVTNLVIIPCQHRVRFCRNQRCNETVVPIPFIVAAMAAAPAPRAVGALPFWIMQSERNVVRFSRMPKCSVW